MNDTEKRIRVPVYMTPAEVAEVDAARKRNKRRGVASRSEFIAGAALAEARTHRVTVAAPSLDAMIDALDRKDVAWACVPCPRPDCRAPQGELCLRVKGEPNVVGIPGHSHPERIALYKAG